MKIIDGDLLGLKYFSIVLTLILLCLEEKSFLIVITKFVN